MRLVFRAPKTIEFLTLTTPKHSDPFRDGGSPILLDETVYFFQALLYLM